MLKYSDYSCYSKVFFDHRIMSTIKKWNQSVTNHTNLQKKLEEANQALYNCKRQIRAYQALEKEYQEELRLLESKQKSKNQQLKEKISQLEEINLNLKTLYNERNFYLEKQLKLKNVQIKELKKDIDGKSTGKEMVKNKKLETEVFELKEKNDELIQQMDELKQSRDSYRNQNLHLQETISKLNEELANYVETLDIKRSELYEAKTLINTLNDDCFYLKSELDLMKSKTSDIQNQCNSLFAEVDDRRVQLQQQMKTLKSKYTEMKLERMTHLKQITNLRRENDYLLVRWETEVEEENRDHYMVIESYKNQVKTLNELIDDYKKKLKTVSETSSGSGIQFIDNLIAEKNKEIEEWKAKYSARSLNQSILSHDLAMTKKEMRKHKLQILKLENEKEELKVSIEELKLNGIQEEEPQAEITENIVKSALKKENGKMMAI